MQFFLVTFLILLYYFAASSNRWNNVLTLFSALMIQGMILGEGTELFGFLDHRIIISIMVIFTAIRYNSTIKPIPFQKLDLYKKYAIYLILLIPLFVLRYIDLKNYLLNIDYELLYEKIPIPVILKRILKESFNLVTFVLIMQRVYFKKAIIAIEKGFLIGISLTILSIIFYDQLQALGYTLRGGIGESNLRMTGFLGMNANHAASVFTMLFGYILAKYERSLVLSPRYLIMIILVLIGIMFTASKTGLFILALLSTIFILRNFRNINRYILGVLIFIIVAVILFNFFGDYLEYRVRTQITGEEDTLTGRITYWQLYIRDIINNPEYLLFGNTASPTYFRSVHNTYIEILFFTGIIPVLILFWIIFKSFKNRDKYIRNPMYFNPGYSLLALYLSWITGAGFLNYWILLIMGISAGIPNYFMVNMIRPESGIMTKLNGDA